MIEAVMVLLFLLGFKVGFALRGVLEKKRRERARPWYISIPPDYRGVEVTKPMVMTFPQTINEEARWGTEEHQKKYRELWDKIRERYFKK